MAVIASEIYGELEAALGAQNVSKDPGTLQSYCYMYSAGGMGNWNPRPICVALPGSTEEVRRVIMICSEHNLTFNAHSTGWFMFGLATNDRCIVMDLRRMNNIEVHEKDCYAVLDPYIPGGEEQAEIMNYGLTCHLVGAGPNCSNLASATSVQGTGGDAQGMSTNERNLLALEWVLPTGEILYLGSIGTPEAGWFCGDGPGPSLRGMLRGALASSAANGVKTRCGLKCYPWPHAPYRNYGSPPFFDSEPVENFAVRLVMWEDDNQEADGLYRLSETEMACFLSRTGPGVFESVLSCTNEEYMTIVDSEIHRRSFPKGPWLLSLNSGSSGELEYRLKALEKIVEETDGLLVDPADMGHDAFEACYQTAIRDVYIPKAAFMPSGNFLVLPPMSYEAIDQIIKYSTPMAIKAKEEVLEAGRGEIEDDYKDNVYLSLDEHGHYGHCEAAYHYEIADPKTEPFGLFLTGLSRGRKSGLTQFYCATPSSLEEFLLDNEYYKKILRMLDPKRIASQGFNVGMMNMGEPLKPKIRAREKQKEEKAAGKPEQKTKNPLKRIFKEKTPV